MLTSQRSHGEGFNALRLVGHEHSGLPGNQPSRRVLLCSEDKGCQFQNDANEVDLGYYLWFTGDQSGSNNGTDLETLPTSLSDKAALYIEWLLLSQG